MLPMNSIQNPSVLQQPWFQRFTQSSRQIQNLQSLNASRQWNNHQHGGEFTCETCDKSFKTDFKLNEHLDEHEVCGRDGCTFTAHPKIIAKHIQMQHMTGLFKRMKEAAEDAKKWIAERKRNYPTRANIEAKKQLDVEKNKRGERINDNKDKFNKHFLNRKQRNNEMQPRSQGQKNRFKKRNKMNRNKRRTLDKQSHSKTFFEENIQKKDEISDEELITENERSGIAAFEGVGISQPSEDQKEESTCFSDNEWAEEVGEVMKKELPVINSSLSLLSAMYNSESEEEEEPTEFKSRSTTSAATKEQNNDEAPEEVKTLKTKEIFNDSTVSVDTRNRKITNKKYRTDARENILTAKRQFRERPPTLLEKLLEKEIKHERNVILQCVRHIVQNNFFD